MLSLIDFHFYPIQKQISRISLHCLVGGVEFSPLHFDIKGGELSFRALYISTLNFDPLEIFLIFFKVAGYWLSCISEWEINHYYLIYILLGGGEVWILPPSKTSLAVLKAVSYYFLMFFPSWRKVNITLFNYIGGGGVEFCPLYFDPKFRALEIFSICLKSGLLLLFIFFSSLKQVSITSPYYLGGASNFAPLYFDTEFRLAQNLSRILRNACLLIFRCLWIGNGSA